MSNEIYEFEISRNREGDLLATAGVKGDSSSYRIAGPKAWGGSSRVASIEITQRDMVEFIRCYAPGALADLVAPSAANGAATCPACKGNDADMPCAYPSEGVKGCVRDVRLSANGEEMPQPTYFGQGPDGSDLTGYTAEQLRAAVLAERNACADIVDNADSPDCGGWNMNHIAERIRART